MKSVNNQLTLITDKINLKFSFVFAALLQSSSKNVLFYHSLGVENFDVGKGLFIRSGRNPGNCVSRRNFARGESLPPNPRSSRTQSRPEPPNPRETQGPSTRKKSYQILVALKMGIKQNNK